MSRIRTTFALGSLLFAGPALAQAPVFSADFDDGDLSAGSATGEREDFGLFGGEALSAPLHTSGVSCAPSLRQPSTAIGTAAQKGSTQHATGWAATRITGKCATSAPSDR